MMVVICHKMASLKELNLYFNIMNVKLFLLNQEMVVYKEKVLFFIETQQKWFSL